MTHHTTFRKLLGALLLCSSTVTVSACFGPYPPDYGYDDGDYPPASYIATAQPVYYEGRPAYYYHDQWYYRDRDRGRWASYGRREPAPLAQRRMAAPAPARRYYGRPSMSRQSVDVSRGGRRR